MAEEELKRRQIAFLYNPALLSRVELKDLFVARHGELRRILSQLGAAGASPQHSLLIGERGMGKTTMLLRVAHSLEEDPALQKKWLPVRFDEEQYNIGGLEDFWLNCLEKISEDTKDPTPGETLRELRSKYQRKELEWAAFLRLRDYSIQKSRHLLLLVDNLDLLLERIEEQGARRLREVLQTETWLMLVGASARPILATFDHDSPFYDFFQVIPLDPLSFEETLDFLSNLGQCFRCGEATENLLRDRRDELEALHILVGGNLRTATLLFSLLQENPSADMSLLLDRLLDQYTTSFKDMVDALPAQGQRVFDALARLWKPVTAENVADELRIPRGVASAQLHRLAERDLVTKIELRTRSIGFQVRDRFLNLWYLMRSGRAQRRQLRALLNFLSIFYRRRPDQTDDRLITRLRRLGLVNDESVREAEAEARRLVEQRSSTQEVLWGADASVSIEVRLLALYLQGDAQNVEKTAVDLLGFKRDHLFASVVRSHLLAGQGKAQEAYDVLTGVATDLPAELQLERARLLIELEKTEEAVPLLMPLMTTEEIPPTEVAAMAILLGTQPGTKLGWLAQGLISAAAGRSPGDPEISLSGCAIELALDHPKQALDQFRQALEAARHGGSIAQREDILAMAIRLGRDQPGDVLAELKTAGLDLEWPPLAHALAFLDKEPELLETLSPEMRSFTKKVLATIQQAGSPLPGITR